MNLIEQSEHYKNLYNIAVLAFLVPEINKVKVSIFYNREILRYV